MTEAYPPDADLNALSGTSDGEQEVLYVPTGESPYFNSFYRMLHRLLLVARRAGDLRVYKDGDLTFGVRAGEWLNGSTPVSFAGTTGQSLTDNAVNDVFLLPDGTLGVTTDGMPDPAAQPHLPLARIAAGTESAAGVSGEYAIADITDLRGRAMLRPADGLGADALQDALPQLAMSVGDEVGDTRTITVQVRDAGGDDLPGRFRVRLWIAPTEFAAPDASGNAVAVSTGAQLRELTADADCELITDADGAAAVDLTVAGAASRYVHAETDGRIHSSGEVTFTA